MSKCNTFVIKKPTKHTEALTTMPNNLPVIDYVTAKQFKRFSITLSYSILCMIGI